MFADKALRLPNVVESILFLIGLFTGFFAPAVLAQALVYLASKFQSVFTSIDISKVKTGKDVFSMLAVIVASIFSLLLLRRVMPLAWGLVLGVLLKVLFSFFNIQLPVLV